MHVAEGNNTRRIELCAPFLNFIYHHLRKFEFFNDNFFSTKVALFLPKLHGRDWVSTKVAYSKSNFYQSYGNHFYQSYNSTIVALFYHSYNFFQSCLQTLCYFSRYCVTFRCVSFLDPNQFQAQYISKLVSSNYGDFRDERKFHLVSFLL